MSQGNQSINFNGKYQYIIIFKHEDKENIYGVYDTLRDLKLGINRLDRFYNDKCKYLIKKVFVKPELVDLMKEEINQIQDYVDKQLKDVERRNEIWKTHKSYFNVEIQ